MAARGHTRSDTLRGGQPLFQVSGLGLTNGSFAWAQYQKKRGQGTKQAGPGLEFERGRGVGHDSEIRVMLTLLSRGFSRFTSVCSGYDTSLLASVSL